MEKTTQLNEIFIDLQVETFLISNLISISLSVICNSYKNLQISAQIKKNPYFQSVFHKTSENSFLMNNLTSQDLFFVKSKIQQSLKLSQSPTKKSKKPENITKSIHNFSANFSAKETIKNSQKSVTRQDLKDWMIKKQLQIKKNLTMKKIQEEEFNVRSSEEIKIRSKQDWFKLRFLKQNSKNFQIKKTQSSEVLPEQRKQKINCEKDNLDLLINETLYLTGIQKHYNLREKNFSNEPKNSHPFEELKINTLKSTVQKISQDNHQKYPQKYKKRDHQHEKCTLKPKKQVGQYLLTPRFDHLFKSKIKKETEQNFKSDDKATYLTLSKTNDSAFKNLLRFSLPTNFPTSQPLKSYSYRQMEPQEQTELRIRFQQLDNRLEQLLQSAREQKVSK